MSKSNIFENSKSSENSVISNFKIIYLHGFNSAAFGRKYDALTETFGEENVFGINQPTSPIATIKLFSFLIESLLQKNTNLWLFGSSQGAFFARYFTYKYGVPSILVNPMIYPDTIKEYINTEMENFKTHKKYVYKKEWSEFLKSLAIKKEQISKFKDRIFIFVDEGDELLDHSQT
ncbi:MAG: YqiA/YcfP family alpha/beta fold hydrolase, partial [Promethearchaeota archaeon]